ncbi:MAG: ABC transporter ATP-binding protein [Methanomassiliicoccales archaeon]
MVFAYDSHPVLNGVSLRLKPSEILGLVGPNGSGKTTLLKCINKILKPEQGEVLLDENHVSGMDRIEVAKHIGYVPQSSNPDFSSPTVYEVVAMGRRPHLGWQVRERNSEGVWEILSMMGIDHLASRGFDELSGGQRQKVLIARALAQEAGVLLLDEPTSDLDIKHQLQVMEMIRNLTSCNGISGIAALHDLNLASRYCDKIVIMKEGKVFAAGEPEEVLTPRNIGTVYGVEVAIERFYGRPHIVVLGSLE